MLILLLYALLPLTSSSLDVLLENAGSNFSCSRAESRKARAILEEIVYPLYRLMRLSIPEQCPWNPQRDMYRVQESLKYQRGSQDWQCGKCGKRFYTEDTLDLHMDNRHRSDIVRVGTNSTCVATLCSLLRCDVLEPDLAFGDRVFWEEALCEEAQFVQLQRQCQDILDQCAEGKGDKYTTIRQWLQKAICDHLTCLRHWDVPDHRVPAPVGTRIVLILLGVVGLIVYYVVLLIRISNPPNSIPASSLSSPYYFISLCSAADQPSSAQARGKTKRFHAHNY